MKYQTIFSLKIKKKIIYLLSVNFPICVLNGEVHFSGIRAGLFNDFIINIYNRGNL